MWQGLCHPLCPPSCLIYINRFLSSDCGQFNLLNEYGDVYSYLVMISTYWYGFDHSCLDMNLWVCSGDTVWESMINFEMVEGDFFFFFFDVGEKNLGVFQEGENWRGWRGECEGKLNIDCSAKLNGVPLLAASARSASVWVQRDRQSYVRRLLIRGHKIPSENLPPQPTKLQKFP